jgi:hypothetical protein
MSEMLTDNDTRETPVTTVAILNLKFIVYLVVLAARALFQPTPLPVKGMQIQTYV